MIPFCIAMLSLAASAAAATDLWTRGYSVIPAPRQVTLAAGDVVLDGGWSLSGAGISARTLVRDLRDFHGLTLRGGAGGASLRLSVVAGAVATKASAAIDREAYRLRVEPRLIEITGNHEAGLFYGVQTLVQLLRRSPDGRLTAPRGVIEDWPAFELRFLHWDTKHHQDRMETLKRYIDWSARFKVNRIGFELEDKFEYPSHPSIGAPGAFTSAQLQEIVDYGLERFIQVTPQIQSPAHMSYVLKHPEFAGLRSDGNNYQSCLCDPRAYDLIFSMYDDAIKATRGVDRVFVSTDEVYYAGSCAKCAKPYNEENRSLEWVEFVRRAQAFLAERKRGMLVWAEYPLLAKHVGLLPPGIIDGVIGEPEYAPIENQIGIRQMAYASMQGGEYLFPSHLGIESERGVAPGRIEQAWETIARGRVWQGKPIGVFGAAWDDNGLHNETFWLGWSAVAQYGWNPGTVTPEQHVAEFMRAYYGPRAEGMVDIYRAMQNQARLWETSWDRVVSKVRGPGYGNSSGKGRGTTRYDFTLTPVNFSTRNEKRIADARRAAIENGRLVLAIEANFAKADRNRYNLEVFEALARFMGHHWRLIVGLAEAEQALERAKAAAPADAVGQMVAAHLRVERLRLEGESTFAALQGVFEKSRYPNGRTVNGRRFVHVLDDTKDHWAGRTPDLSFMMAPERSIGLEAWLKDLRARTLAYAKANGVPVKALAEERLEQ